MSTTAEHTAEHTAERTADQEASRRAAAYRRRVERLHRGYQCRARRNTVCANALSLVLVVVGAGIGVTAMIPGNPAATTAVLGAVVVLLEGVSRVLRPAVRAARAGRTARALDRECRLFDARGRGYRAGGAAADAAFVDAVERVLDHASAEEDRDDTGSASETVPVVPERAARRGLRTVE